VASAVPAWPVFGVPDRLFWWPLLWLFFLPLLIDDPDSADLLFGIRWYWYDVWYWWAPFPFYWCFAIHLLFMMTDTGWRYWWCVPTPIYIDPFWLLKNIENWWWPVDDYNWFYSHFIVEVLVTEVMTNFSITTILHCGNLTLFIDPCPQPSVILFIDGVKQLPIDIRKIFIEG